MKIHYLEIVTLDINETCTVFENAFGTQFSEPDPLLGNARTAPMPDSGTLGIRAPMSDTEEPVTRTYFLIDDIDAATKSAVEAGAELAHPIMELPGKGQFSIVIQGGNHFGFWQV